MKQSSPTQNPSKVVITPKPPKNNVDTAPVPEVSKETLEIEKLEEAKESKDSIKVEKSVPAK